MSKLYRGLERKLLADQEMELARFEKDALIRWSKIDLDTTYWVEFEFKSWADSGWVQLYFGDADTFEFKKSECSTIAQEGAVLGNATARFRCRRLSKILFWDASSEPTERLLIMFPDQLNQSVINDFHFVVDGIDGNMVDYTDHVKYVKGAPFFNKLIALKINN